MKSAAENHSWISAYPLRALNLPEEEYQSELKLWTNGTGKTVAHIRVMPMVNPYREKDFITETQKNNSDKL
ncbi:MAG: hypothetical protein WDO19_13295 [Bacteroidota bacterium]